MSQKCYGRLIKEKEMANGDLELLITSYYNIVRRTMIDMVPKAVMLTLVQ